MQITPWDVAISWVVSVSVVLNDGAYCRVPTPHARIRSEVDLYLLVLGVWLRNHLSLLVLLFGVPRPEASTPLLCRLLLSPPPRSFLPVGIGRWHHSNASVRMDGFKLEGGELFKENFRKLLKQE